MTVVLGFDPNDSANGTAAAAALLARLKVGSDTERRKDTERWHAPVVYRVYLLYGKVRF